MGPPRPTDYAPLSWHLRDWPLRWTDRRPDPSGTLAAALQSPGSFPVPTVLLPESLRALPLRRGNRAWPGFPLSRSDGEFYYRKGNGRGERIRTFDPLHPMQVRYQAALRPDRE